MFQVQFPGKQTKIKFCMQDVYLGVPLGSIFGGEREWKQKWMKQKVKL